MKRPDFAQEVLIENIDESNPSTTLRKKDQDASGSKNQFEIKRGFTNIYILKDALVSSKVR